MKDFYKYLLQYDSPAAVNATLIIAGVIILILIFELFTYIRNTFHKNKENDS